MDDQEKQIEKLRKKLEKEVQQKLQDAEDQFRETEGMIRKEFKKEKKGLLAEIDT